MPKFVLRARLQDGTVMEIEDDPNPENLIRAVNEATMAIAAAEKSLMISFQNRNVLLTTDASAEKE